LGKKDRGAKHFSEFKYLEILYSYFSQFSVKNNLLTKRAEHRR
jgi:hypothetical protein